MVEFLEVKFRSSEWCPVVSFVGIWCEGGSGGEVCLIFFEFGGLEWGRGDLSMFPFKEVDVQHVCGHDIFVYSNITTSRV